MTVASSVNKTARLACDGVITRFDFTFKIFESANLQVYLTNVQTDAEALQTEVTDYTVTINDDYTGYITFGTAPSSAYVVTIIRELDIVQETDLSNQGAFFPEVLEKQHDKGIMIAQQLKEELDRCLKAPLTSTDDPTTLYGELEAAANASEAYTSTYEETVTDLVKQTFTVDFNIDATKRNVAIHVNGLKQAGSAFTLVDASGNVVVSGTTKYVKLNEYINQGDLFEASSLDITGTGTSSYSAETLLSTFGGDLATAITTIGALDRTLLMDTAINLTEDVTVPSNISLRFTPTGVVTIASGKTLTINGNIDAGLYQIFAGSGSVVAGSECVVGNLYPEWWGAIADGSTDCTTALQAAADFNGASFRRAAVILSAGTYNVTTTVTFDILGSSIKGVDRLSSLIYFNTDADTCIEMTAEHCVIEKLGFVCTGGDTPDNTALSITGPSTTIRDVFISEYATGISMTQSWNSSVQDCFLASNRSYGIKCSNNCNAMNFRNNTLTGNSGGTECGYHFTDSHGVSIKGGAIENFKHALYQAGSEVSFDGYVESQDDTDFYLASSSDKLTIVNLYAHLNSTTANRGVVEAAGGMINVLQAKCSGGTGGYTKFFDLTGGAKGFYQSLSLITNQIIGTCVVNSGGMIQPMIGVNKRTLTVNVDCSITSSTRVFALGFVSRPWKIGRIATYPLYGSPSSVASIKLGTDASDDEFLTSSLVSNTARILTGWTQPGIPYTDQTGWLLLTVSQSGTAAAGFTLVVELYDNSGNSTVDGSLSDLLDDRANIARDMLI